MLIQESSRYVSVVGAAFAMIFFTNIPSFAAAFVWNVQPIHFMALMFIAMLPACVHGSGLKIHLFAPLVLWCFFYLSICFVSYALLAPGPTDPLKDRILAISFMLLTFVLFSHSAATIRVVRLSLVPCVVFGAVMNGYHFANPFGLYPAESSWVLIGRAAGLYLNPNQAAAALLLGLILTIDLIRPNFRSLYCLIVFGGVVLTASRAGIAAIVLITATFLYTRRLRMGDVLRISLLSCALALLFIRVVSGFVGETQLDWSLVFDRLGWFSSFGEQADFSQNERQLLAALGLELFAEHPFVGAGLGSTELWDARTSTHNWYIMAMADFGILGAFVLPLLVTACAGGLRGLLNERNLPFVIFTLWWGLFSHNILGEFFFMIAISLMAALSQQNGMREPSSTRNTDGSGVAHAERRLA